MKQTKMKNFKLILNWNFKGSIKFEVDPIAVYYNGRKIGSCEVCEMNQTLTGSFSLNEEVDEDQFVFYSISASPEHLLSGIIIDDFSLENKKRANTIGNTLVN